MSEQPFDWDLFSKEVELRNGRTVRVGKVPNGAGGWSKQLALSEVHPGHAHRLAWFPTFEDAQAFLDLLTADP